MVLITATYTVLEFWINITTKACYLVDKKASRLVSIRYDLFVYMFVLC